jgi:long-subunit acyl-CoA synthetase (AMP-forming)
MCFVVRLVGPHFWSSFSSVVPFTYHAYAHPTHTHPPTHIHTHTTSPLTETDLHFSFRPLNDVRERHVIDALLRVGGSVGFVSGQDHRIIDDMRALRPTVLFSDPSPITRLYKLYRMAVATWGFAGDTVFKRAYTLKKNILFGDRKSLRWLVRLLNVAIFASFPRRLGGRVRLICLFSDGFMPPIHKEFFNVCFSCPIIEMFTRDEGGVIAATDTSLSHRLSKNHVGRPVGEAEVRLHDLPEKGFRSDGANGAPEIGLIAVRSPALALRYPLPPEYQARRVLDGQWLLTRQIGQWGADGNLVVLGHMRGLVEPYKGHLVFNQYLENVYKESTFVHQIFVTCRQYRPLVAVVVLDPERAFHWRKAQQQLLQQKHAKRSEQEEEELEEEEEEEVTGEQEEEEEEEDREVEGEVEGEEAATETVATESELISEERKQEQKWKRKVAKRAGPIAKAGSPQEPRSRGGRGQHGVETATEADQAEEDDPNALDEQLRAAVLADFDRIATYMQLRSFEFISAVYLEKRPFRYVRGCVCVCVCVCV